MPNDTQDRPLKIQSTRTREAAPVWERLRALATRQGILLTARVELSGTCNLRCLHCYAESADDRQVPDFSTARGIELMAELAHEGCLSVNLTGGELALRPDWLEIAWAAKRQRMTVALLTNATLFSDDDIHEISRLHVRLVAVSLYGASAATHDALTGVSGSFVAAVDNLRQLREMGVPCRISTVLMRDAVAAYRPLLDLAHTLGCGFLAEPTVRPRADGRDDVVRCLRAPAEDLRGFYSDQEILEGCLEGGIICSQREPVREHMGNCAAGQTLAHICANGDVVPCTGFGEVFGNIVDRPFADAWHGDAAKRHRELMAAPLRACSECGLLPYCTQRCPRLAYVEDGDISGPSRRACDVAQLVYTMRHESTHGGLLSREEGGASG